MSKPQKFELDVDDFEVIHRCINSTLTTSTTVRVPKAALEALLRHHGMLHNPARWLGHTREAQAEKVIEAEAGAAFGPPNDFGPEASPAEFDAATLLPSGMPRAAKSLESLMVRREAQPRRLPD